VIYHSELRLTITDQRTRETSQRVARYRQLSAGTSARGFGGAGGSDVSRRHARLELVDSQLVLTDLGGTGRTSTE
jgi:hypothetical protein